MKALIAFLVVGVIVVIAFGWWYAIGAAADAGFRIPFACGKGRSGALEVHVAVAMQMTALEPPRVDPVSGAVYWTEWVDEHFELRDASDQLVRLQRNNFSSLIPEGKVGSPDFYLIGQIQEGTRYTFDYIPIKTNPERYRYEFMVSGSGQEFGRVHFAPLD